MLIAEKYSELFPNEELVAEIKIVNIKRTGLTNINLEYAIEKNNPHQQILFQEFESKTFDNALNFLKRIKLPLNIKPGYYMFTVKLQDGKDTAIAGYPFKVNEVILIKERTLSNLYLSSAIIAVLVIIIFLIYELKKINYRKELKSRKKYIYKQIERGLDNGRKR